MIRQSYTAVVERNRLFEGAFSTEPYECGWAREAIFFIRILEAEGQVDGTAVWAEISPDGIHWRRHGEMTWLSREEEVDHCSVTHFGNWLRLSGELKEGASMKAIITLHLKE